MKVMPITTAKINSLQKQQNNNPQSFKGKIIIGGIEELGILGLATIEGHFFAAKLDFQKAVKNGILTPTDDVIKAVKDYLCKGKILNDGTKRAFFEFPDALDGHVKEQMLLMKQDLPTATVKAVLEGKEFKID